MSETNYEADARADAFETMDNYVDTMVEQFRESGEVSDDLYNDYDDGDGYHHSNHVDKDYRLKEASDLLDQLSAYEETDNGLWDGAEPRRAIAIQAAYTYGNAVRGLFSDLVSDLNRYLDTLGEYLREEETGLDDSTDEWKASGERLIRTFVLFGDDDGEWSEGLLSAAWGDVQVGGTTALMVLADKAQEVGREYFARTCREIAAITIGETEPEAE